MHDQGLANNMDTRSDSDIDTGPNIVNNSGSRQQQQQHHSRRRQQRHSATSTNSNVNRPASQSSNYSNSISRTSSTSSLHRDDSEASTPTTASEDELDAEHEELVRLRCQSICTEVIADRHKRKNRCADYPGLAFGTSIFSSNTLMKFSIIKNELHNITNVQLKRAESEVAALNRRIQLLEEDLERSEERLKIATQKLEEASHSADESERIRKALENRTNMEDDRVSILEAQLAQAKMIAEEADKKYEECVRLI